MVGFVIGNLVSWSKVVVAEFPRKVEVASSAAWHVETEVYEEVVGLCGAVVSKVVAYQVASVMVLVVTVVAAWGIRIERSVVIGGEKADVVDSLCGIVHVDNFEAAIFVSCRENECLVVGILETARDRVGGLDEGYARILLKALAVCYITQLAADCCRDAGESAIASKIELAGKAAIVAVSLPVFTELAELVTGLVSV